MATAKESADQLDALEDLAQFPLMEALIGRRSRRFGLGGEIPDGVLAYKSKHEPMPLSELERSLVLASIGALSCLLGDAALRAADSPVTVLSATQRRAVQPVVRGDVEVVPIDAVLVSHAHFDHLHRPSLRAIARHSRRRSKRTPVIIVPEHVGDLVSDLLASDADIELVTRESGLAGQMGIQGVPAFVLQGKYMLVGAQDTAVLLRVFDKVQAKDAAAG